MTNRNTIKNTRNTKLIYFVLLYPKNFQARIIIHKKGVKKFLDFQREVHCVILDHPIFLLVEVLTLRQGRLYFLKWNHVFFFDDITDFKMNSAYNTRSFWSRKV